jgi:hypothetical protein
MIVQREEHVAFTEYLEAHGTALRILLHAPAQLRVVHMRYTWESPHGADQTEPSILGWHRRRCRMGT